MLSLCHIFSDSKFVDASMAYFISDLYENTVVFIGDAKSYKGNYGKIIEFVEYHDKNAIEKITNICGKHDVIICYNLDYHKSIIVNRLPSDKKIVWRFFGTEFYSLPQQQLNILSDKTKKVLNINSYDSIKDEIVGILRFFKYALKLKRTPIAEFNKAINKIHYFLSFDEGEYAAIRKNWNVFPEFLEISGLAGFAKRSTLNSKNNNIVIGNSRAHENNHFDIIDLFDEGMVSQNNSLVFPLSYGHKGIYYHRLIDRIKSSKMETHIIEDFLPFHSYVEKIANAKAAIINSYRQMGLGNMFIFLGNNTKLYLSERNPSFKWMTSLGFSIYSVEKDLKKDIEMNNFNLETDIGEKNKNIVNKLSDDGNRLNFQNTFYRTLRYGTDNVLNRNIF